MTEQTVLDSVRLAGKLLSLARHSAAPAKPVQENFDRVTPSDLSLKRSFVCGPHSLSPRSSCSCTPNPVQCRVIHGERSHKPSQSSLDHDNVMRLNELLMSLIVTLQH